MCNCTCKLKHNIVRVRVKIIITCSGANIIIFNRKRKKRILPSSVHVIQVSDTESETSLSALWLRRREGCEEKKERKKNERKEQLFKKMCANVRNLGLQFKWNIHDTTHFLNRVLH